MKYGLLKFTMSNITNTIHPALVPSGFPSSKGPATLKALTRWVREKAPNFFEKTSPARAVSEITTGVGGLGFLFTSKDSFIAPTLTFFGAIGTVASWLLEPNLNVGGEKAVPPKTAQRNSRERGPLPEPSLGEIMPEGEPVLPSEESRFKELIEEMTSLKVSILEDDLEKREERNKVSRLINIINDTTGVRTKTGLKGNQLKLREYTLSLIRDIVINSNNNQTIKRFIETIFKIFMKDTKDALKTNAGLALVLISKEPGGMAKLTKYITGNLVNVDAIIQRLEALKK